jgi:hypothetical protein
LHALSCVAPAITNSVLMHALCDGVHDVLQCTGVKMSSSLLEAWRTRTLAGGRYSLEKERR